MTVRFQRVFSAALSASLLFSGFHAIAQDATKPTYTVINCNDGDTCRMKSTDNTTVKVRLVGIDAPETRHGNKEGPEGQPFGLESRDYLNSLVKGKTVSLKTVGTDLYSRNLAEIFVDEKNVNIQMVKEGFAEVYKGKGNKGFDMEPYLRAEVDAKKDKKGIWNAKTYQSPMEYRKLNK